MSKKLTTPRGKIIRDPVHGDIFIKEKFVDIIDTPEFQRLRRIRQLSMGNLLFPSAEHSRFSHSIGTYHVMKLIIDHFQNVLNDVYISIKSRDIDLVLAAALLHDIGHGPFSHAFENVLEDLINSKKYKDHEAWTVKIINSDDSNIKSVLKTNFDNDFPNDVAKLINKSFNKKSCNKNELEVISLEEIASSLVSSQLDADRMDYLLRDSFFTGVSYGNFDLERLIKSLRITVQDDNYYVCVLEKYLSTIDEYLLSRYQIYKEIYLHEFKIEMELVLAKIMKRAYELYNNDNEFKKNKLPRALISVFKDEDIKIKDYISLDDISILSLIKKWEKDNDQILSYLSKTILNREKFKRFNILNNSEKNIEEFKKKLAKIFLDYGYKVNDFNQEYFWLEDSSCNQVYEEIYKKEKEMIGVLKNNGVFKNYIDVSEVIREAKEVSKKKNDKKIITFINLNIVKEIIKQETKQETEQALNEIKELIKMYNSRNFIEIEKKYTVKNKEIFEDIIKTLKKEFKEYNIGEEVCIRQEDEYYDTPSNKLLNSSITLRIRERENEKILTLKTPVSGERDDDRFEYEKVIEKQTLKDYEDFIYRYLSDVDFSNCDFDSLKPSIKIQNSRKQYELKRDNVIFEIVFDDVEYHNKCNNKKDNEYQIEIELKSDYSHRVVLNKLAKILENEFKELKPINESKYQRAVKFTKN